MQSRNLRRVQSRSANSALFSSSHSQSIRRAPRVAPPAIVYDATSSSCNLSAVSAASIALPKSVQSIATHSLLSLSTGVPHAKSVVPSNVPADGQKRPNIVRGQLNDSHDAHRGLRLI
jgi:hypothetical protein